jgi:hypothetical protein
MNSLCLERGGGDVHGGEQAERGRHEQGPDQGVDPVAAGAGDEAARDDRGGDHPAHQRGHQQAGVGGGGAGDDLEEDGQEDDGAEHRRADDEPAGRDHGEGPGAAQAERDDGGGGGGLPEHEQSGQQRAADRQPDQERGPPREGVAAQGCDQQQRGHPADQQRGTEVVDRAGGSTVGEAQHPVGDHEGGDADGEVDEERPAPVDVVDEEPADEGPLSVAAEQPVG